MVTALKEAVDIPIEMHTHYTSGVASMTYLKAVEAGADIIDTAMSPFALGTSQPATEVMVETFKGTPYDTGLDQNLLAEIADYFRPIRDEALESGLAESEDTWALTLRHCFIRFRVECLSNLTISACRSRVRKTSSMRYWRKCREYVKTLVSRRLLHLLPRSLVLRLYLTC